MFFLQKAVANNYFGLVVAVVAVVAAVAVVAVGSVIKRRDQFTAIFQLPLVVAVVVG